MPLAILVNGNSASASEILGNPDRNQNLWKRPQVYHCKILYPIRRMHTPGWDRTGHRNLPVSQVPREDDTQLQKAVEVIHGQID